MKRVVTAIVLMPVLWVVIKHAPAELFLAISILVVSITSWECYRLLEAAGWRPFKWLGLLAAAAVAVSFAEIGVAFEAILPITVLSMVTLMTAMWRRSDPRAMLDTALTTLFPVLFVGLGLGYVIRLRGLPGEYGTDSLLLLFACVILADIAAFYVGTSLGRHRMAPRLSPKKSWEGAAAGIAGSLAGAAMAHLWFYRRLPWEHALALGVLLGIGAILGDLAESVVKRATGVKDSSALLPGHGGLFDRTDSLLFSGPILYYYSVTFLTSGP